MSTDPNSHPDLQRKLMKGKYDGRQNNGATKARRRVFSNLGRKPKWMKHLSRNKAWEMLDEFDSLASPAQIYAYCWEKKQIDYLLRLREYVWNRAEGRPFVAVNPEATAKVDVLKQDNRLQLAIKELVIEPEARRAAEKCRNQLQKP